MANLDESSDVWPAGIRQIETGDPVLGGPPDEGAGTGIPNISLQQLAIRTRKLKAWFDAISIPAATDTVAGIVKLVNSVTSTATDKAATAASVKAANDNAEGRLSKAANLSDLSDAVAARTNLSLGTMAQQAAGTGGTQFRTNNQNDTRFAQRGNNLSDLSDAAAARTALSLGTMAQKVAGTGGTQFRTNEENDSRFARLANNLSDLASKATARTNLDVAQKQASETDGEVGRALLVGAFGSLGATAAPLSSDLDVLSVHGHWRAATGGNGIPEDGTFVVENLQRIAGAGGQIAYRMDADAIFYRRKPSGGPQAWVELFHTGNIGDLPLFGISQSWQDVSSTRAVGVTYQNSTLRPIMVKTRPGRLGDGNPEPAVEVSADGAAWVNVNFGFHPEDTAVSFVVPPGHYYRQTNGAIGPWIELR